jgi:hypothetical protein
MLPKITPIFRLTEKETIADFMERIGAPTYELIVGDSGDEVQVQLYLVDNDLWLTGEGDTLESALNDLEEALT